MHARHLKFASDFHVVLSNRRAQAAEMTLPPGDVEGGPDNNHRGADQWLFVLSGTGQARIAGRTLKLKAGSLLLIEKGENHEILNTGRVPLQTLNFYVPPAYSSSDEPLPRGRAQPPSKS